MILFDSHWGDPIKLYYALTPVLCLLINYQVEKYLLIYFSFKIIDYRTVYTVCVAKQINKRLFFYFNYGYNIVVDISSKHDLKVSKCYSSNQLENAKYY